MWTKVTGQAIEFVKIDTEAYVRIWGPAGAEVALNMEFFKLFPDTADWGQGKVLGQSDLGVEKETMGTQQTLENFKELLMG